MSGSQQRRHSEDWMPGACRGLRSWHARREAHKNLGGPCRFPEVGEGKANKTKADRWRRGSQIVPWLLDYQPGKFFWRERVRPKYLRIDDPALLPVVDENGVDSNGRARRMMAALIVCLRTALIWRMASWKLMPRTWTKKCRCYGFFSRLVGGMRAQSNRH